LARAGVEEVRIGVGGGDSLNRFGSGIAGAVVGNRGPGSARIGPGGWLGPQSIPLKSIRAGRIGIGVGIIKDIGEGSA
jgi:hypothetical protein